MNWFYATNDQKQAGPVDESTLQEMIRTGEITPATMVWKQDMDNWRPYSTIFSPPPQPMQGVDGLTQCAECHQAFPADQLISLAGRPVCASCKPVAVQKLQEGVVAFGDPANAEDLWRNVEQRGFDFSISSVLSRSWTLVKGNFWPCVGVTLLLYMIMIGAGQIPLLGLVATFLVQPQIMAGLNWYFLKQFRGEEATLNDSFAGFRRGYGQQAIYMLILFAIIIGLVVVIAVPMALFLPMISAAAKANGGEPMGILLIFAAVIPAICIMWYFMLCWIFAPLLILEKGLSALAAMKLSRRVVHLRFWKILGLLFIVGLLCLAGLLALIVGVVVVLPVAFATVSRIYEDAFGDKDTRSPLAMP